MSTPAAPQRFRSVHAGPALVSVTSLLAVGLRVGFENPASPAGSHAVAAAGFLRFRPGVGRARGGMRARPLAVAPATRRFHRTVLLRGVTASPALCCAGFGAAAQPVLRCARGHASTRARLRWWPAGAVRLRVRDTHLVPRCGPPPHSAAGAPDGRADDTELDNSLLRATPAPRPRPRRRGGLNLRTPASGSRAGRPIVLGPRCCRRDEGTTGTTGGPDSITSPRQARGSACAPRTRTPGSFAHGLAQGTAPAQSQV